MNYNGKFIYFARPVGEVGPIKIGCSVYPKSRVSQMTIDYKTPLELIAEYPGDNAIERRIHRLFAADRIRFGNKGGCTEWFTASPRVLDFVAKCMRCHRIVLGKKQGVDLNALPAPSQAA